MSRRKRREVVPGLWFLIGGVVMEVLDARLPGARPVPGQWRYGGLLLLLAGIGVALWAVALFWQKGATMRPGKAATSVVESGPFRFSRHPMYLGLTVGLGGLAVLLGSLTPWAVAVAFFLLVARPAAIGEEHAMEAALGEAYRRYEARVRRWL